MEKMAEKLPLSVESVMSNEDLLFLILVRLPVLSLILFKSVSKNWLSLIRNAINVTFSRNLDPPCGLFLQKVSFKNHSGSYSYEFVPLDIRIPLLGTNFTFGHDDFRIVDACNGLLLCHTNFEMLYVCNPSITNMFKVLPQPNIDNFTFCDGLKMAFDPTKSPHYKVIYAEILEPDMDDIDDIDDMDDMVQLHTFSSETGNWSLYGDQFHENCFPTFDGGVFWNDAIYWTSDIYIFKLDIMNEHPVLTTLRPPLTSYLKVVFESRGSLLLFGTENACSQHFTIYEKSNVYSEWSVKYIINLDEIIKPFPISRWIPDPRVSCIVLGEREEDSFLVMKLDKKVVQYKIVSKTLKTIISDSGDRVIGCFEFISSFANV